jgi:hypothetical protein
MLAGLAIVWSGVAAAFAANALSYIASLLALVSIRVASTAPESSKRRSFNTDLQEGIRYAATHPAIAALFVLLVAVGIGAVERIQMAHRDLCPVSPLVLAALDLREPQCVPSMRPVLFVSEKTQDYFSESLSKAYGINWSNVACLQLPSKLLGEPCAPNEDPL